MELHYERMRNMEYKAILDHTKEHQKYFEEITRIPHGSYHEETIADYIVNVAHKHQLRVKKDHMNNVIVWKAASQGYEDHEPVLLQAHTDMVCEKNKDVDFDFASDALQLYIEDGYLKAKGTTLGADDGVGVAYMLAILTDDTLSHPSLECIFTVQEEVGLFGALALTKEDIQARRMINLDDGDETSTCITSAGGMNVVFQRPYKVESHQWNGYRLTIKGLEGGHSGGAIDKEKGNAHKLAARVLQSISKTDELRIAEWNGGLMDNAIPRESVITFASPVKEEKIQAIINKMQTIFYKELEFSDAGITIECKKTNIENVLIKEDSSTLLQMMLLIPSGLRHHSMNIPGLSTASSNVAIIQMSDDNITIHVSIRGALESFVDQIADELDIVGSLLGYSSKHEARYPAWSYDEQSALRTTMQNVCQSMYHKELELVAVHGGLECGVFKALQPALEIVTMCAIMHDIHTPQERLCLDSFDRTYTFLISILKEL